MPLCTPVLFSHRLPYAAAQEFQRELVRLRIDGRIGDVVLLLEHDPVVTLGVRAGQEHVRLSQKALDARGIGLVKSSRGGDVTYHGPGQLVMYPILKLEGPEADTHGYLRNLEEIAIRTAADFGVQAFRRKGMTGAWTREGKLAAIGIRVQHWVTFHGLSFNVAPDLTGFETIVPCGLHGEPVTSLARLLGERCPELADVRRHMLRHLGEVCARELAPAVLREALPRDIATFAASVEPLSPPER